MSIDLTGRVVLVTGGTKGLGRGLVVACQEAGASVMTCARTAPEGASDDFVAADLRDATAAASVVAATISRYGRLDAVINNAGGTPPSELATASPRLIEKIIALNLLAPIYVAQAACGVMHSQPEGGTIINIGSLSGHRGSPGTAPYGAAKAGLANLTKSLSKEWAPKVRVNSVTVGYLETEQAALFYGNDAQIAAVAKTVPMQRLVTPADVGVACVFLASAEAAFITGADLAVDGGGELPPFLSAASHE